ncbi:amino acid carrier protein [Fusobacterium varium]|uniref:alanine/glycine:cation symporter family protein n=1 Tax=Fusobacterium varium TaxID=856 RepID=UPI003029E94F
MILQKISNFIWGDWLIAIILLTGLHYTFILKGIQFRKFFYIFKKALSEKKSYKEENKITAFQALTAALGSCVGNGNIVGVATAVIGGGPGALFWMWTAAFIGMAVKYGEIFLGIKYREKNEEGEYNGGPMYYISKGLNLKFLGTTYAVLLLIQNSGGTLIQGNVMKDVFHDFFKLPAIIVSVVLTSIIFFITVGGFRRLMKAMEKLVPLMTIFYFIVGFIIIGAHFDKIPTAFFKIFSSAFNFNSAVAGAVGYSIKESLRYGISRGIYSNEAGEGTAAIFYSKINDEETENYGLYGILEVFIDTIVVCTISGLVVILCTDVAKDMSPTQVLMDSFESIHYTFKYFLGFAMFLFGFTSMLGQWVLGKTSFRYITVKNYDKIYNIIFLIVVFFAPHFSSGTVWYIQDIALGLLILPNIFAINILGGEVKENI